MCVRVCACMRLCMCICMHACVHACRHVFVCLCVCVCVCVYTLAKSWNTELWICSNGSGCLTYITRIGAYLASPWKRVCLTLKQYKLPCTVFATQHAGLVDHLTDDFLLHFLPLGLILVPCLTCFDIPLDPTNLCPKTYGGCRGKESLWDEECSFCCFWELDKI